MIMCKGEEFFRSGVQDEPRMKTKVMKGILRDCLRHYGQGDYRIWLTSKPKHYGVVKKSRWERKLLEQVLRNDLYSAVNTRFRYIKVSHGCCRYTEDVLRSLFFHEIGHIVLRHDELYDPQNPVHNHKSEFDADDFSSNAMYSLTGTVTINNLGLLLRSYGTPNWWDWSFTHPSSLARYRRQARRWNLPSVEELEVQYEVIARDHRGE